MNLYRKYRPEEFEEVLGNDSTVESFKNNLEKTDRPHAYLLSGPAGTGKTTLARIAARKLGADPMSITEINTAENRGIDTARELIEQMAYTPMGGNGTRVFIIDECFHKDALVSTPTGRRKVSEINTGESIYSAHGISKVNSTFKNKVDLSRVTRINLSNGETIICSREHKFFTDSGWQSAEWLTPGVDFLANLSYTMSNIVPHEDFKNEPKKIRKNLYHLWSPIFGRLRQSQVLLESLWGEIREPEETSPMYMPRMRRLLRDTKQAFHVLFKALFGYKQNEAPGNQESRIFKGSERARNENTLHISKHSGGDTKQTSIFPTNENKQSDGKSHIYGKGNRDKETAGYFGSAEIPSRGERQNNTSSEVTGGSASTSNGSRRTYKENNAWRAIFLQIGYWGCLFAAWCRNRWPFSQFQKSQIDRSEKNEVPSFTGVDSITFYKRGSTDRYFDGYISDSEKDQGFVYFYDLEIAGYPAYFVQNVLVHNCHATTKDWQNAMLKPLEDTPKHVYFFLCTTDPGKMSTAIKTRCTSIDLKSLDEDTLYILLRRVSKKEGLEFSKDILRHIAENSSGSPRMALVLLEKCIGMTDEAKMREVVTMGEEATAGTIDLCRALLKSSGWGEISKILKAIKDEEPERVRQAVLGYMNSVLLGGQNSKAAIAIECFSETFFYSGKAGLTLACYQTVVSD